MDEEERRRICEEKLSFEKHESEMRLMVEENQAEFMKGILDLHESNIILD